ncbi:MAG TPA: hypothetical protein GX399_10575 [Xanthomonadaceae bacterium]|nr:hypothetical protein [Xanthomonadaceae bacterium]
MIDLPPYCSELNPIERLWQALKRHLTDLAATTRFTLDTLCQAVDHFVQTISSLLFPGLRFCIVSPFRRRMGHSDLREAISMAKRYFTSDLSSRS